MSYLQTIPTLAHIEEAQKRIAPLIVRTPVMSSPFINQMLKAELFFKCENFQQTGSFKMRGASNAIFSLTEEDAKNGVATHSSGNHAQAVACAAKQRGIPSYIVMPQNAPKIKIEGVESYNGQIFFCEPTLQARETTVEQVIIQTNAAFIHPFNDYRIIAGQATCAKELIEDTPTLDIVISPVGGGGLMSGTALSTHYLLPNAQMIATEPLLADDAFRSFHSGKMEPVLSTATIADGLRTSLGEKTFEIMQKYVSNVFTAKEESIVKAMRIIWEKLKIIIEPSCAVPLAALIDNPSNTWTGKRIGIILTGGNVDLDKLPWQV
jgi:threonine dehydratase